MTDMPNLDRTKDYFAQRLTTHGATPRGVDWNSESAQELRFAQLCKVITSEKPFSLLDYGSGYGALADYLLRQGYPLQHYQGYDIVEAMVSQGQALHVDQPLFHFTSQLDALTPLDFAIASGIFNIKLESTAEDWTRYVVGELTKINQLSRAGFSFNMLTSYSDADHMRPDLYYADPCFFFDYCKRNFSRNVALLHDYELYDFTILVRKA